MIPGAATRVFALVGRPVRHSRSPEIYNPLFDELGLDAVYVAFDVAPESAADLGRAIRCLGLAGVNLTVPHKAAILDELVEIDAVGRAVGAVNTVVCRDGALHGYNTDASGFARSLLAELGALPDGPALILGAGGAGRAVAAGLLQAGMGRVVLLNRTRERAEAAARDLAAAFGADRAGAAGLTEDDFRALAPGAGLVVQATSGPARAAIEALPLAVLPADCVWADLNYWDPAPAGWARARQRGLRTVDGLPMLAYQAAEAMGHFTGHVVDPERILARLR